MSRTMPSLEKLYTAEDEYLYSKFTTLVSHQEHEKLKAKVKSIPIKASKPALTILTQPPSFQHSTSFRIGLDSSLLKPFFPKASEGSQPARSMERPNAGGAIQGEASALPGREENDEEEDKKKEKEDLKKQLKSLDRVNEIVHRTKTRYKLQTTTKELKFNEKIKEFKKLDTFFNVKTLLEQINLTNTAKSKAQQRKTEGDHLATENESRQLDDEDEDDENEGVPVSPYSCSLRRGLRALESQRKLREKQKEVKDEDLDNKLALSERMSDYLRKNLRRDFDVGFERVLLDDFERNERFFLQSKRNRLEKASISQEKEVRDLEKFVQNKLRETVLKTQLQNGRYLEKFKAQAQKVLEILKKTTKNIYSNKAARINKALQAKNSALAKKMNGTAGKSTEKPGPIKSKSLHKPEVFLTEEEPKPRKQRASIMQASILPIIQLSLQEKETLQRRILKRNKSENMDFQRKMQGFLNECDEQKTRIMYEKLEHLKEIELVQNTIDSGLERLKGGHSKADSLRMTLDKSSLLRQKYRTGKARGSSMKGFVGFI